MIAQLTVYWPICSSWLPYIDPGPSDWKIVKSIGCPSNFLDIHGPANQVWNLFSTGLKFLYMYKWNILSGQNLVKWSKQMTWAKLTFSPTLQHRRKCHLFFAGTETMNTYVSFITVYKLIIQITQVHVHTCSSRIVFITLLHI